LGIGNWELARKLDVAHEYEKCYIIVIFSCEVGVPPAQNFDEKDFSNKSNQQ
jgi:hypothetical protein